MKKAPIIALLALSACDVQAPVDAPINVNLNAPAPDAGQWADAGDPPPDPPLAKPAIAAQDPSGDAGDEDGGTPVLDAAIILEASSGQPEASTSEAGDGGPQLATGLRIDPQPGTGGPPATARSCTGTVTIVEPSNDLPPAPQTKQVQETWEYDYQTWGTDPTNTGANCPQQDAGCGPTWCKGECGMGSCGGVASSVIGTCTEWTGSYSQQSCLRGVSDTFDAGQCDCTFDPISDEQQCPLLVPVKGGDDLVMSFDPATDVVQLTLSPGNINAGFTFLGGSTSVQFVCP